MLENEIINIGEEFRFFSALLCLATLIYLIFKKPAGVLFIGLILNSGMGSTSVFFTTFAILGVIIQIITIIKLLQLVNMRKTIIILPDLSKIYIVLLTILLLKVIVHVYFYTSSNDLFIYLEIGKTFLFTVLFPILIFYLSVAVYGIRIVSRDLFVGTFLLSISIFIPFLIPLLETGYLMDGLSGAVRIKMYSEDTINGARIFYLISVISILALYFNLDININRKYLWGIFLFSFLLCLLSGSRQFILPILVIVLFYGNYFKKSVSKLVIAFIFIAAFSFVDFSENESLSRLNRAAINEEASESRGQIWALGFSQMLYENPISGLGYSNFGDGFSYDRKSSGDKSYIRNLYPHGFLQSIFIEEGVPLGLAFVIIILLILFLNKSYFDPFQRAIFIIIISFNWAESFSGDIENSMSFYLLPFIIIKSEND
jgi:hypothetical protein